MRPRSGRPAAPTTLVAGDRLRPGTGARPTSVAGLRTALDAAAPSEVGDPHQTRVDAGPDIPETGLTLGHVRAHIPEDCVVALETPWKRTEGAGATRVWGI